MNRSRGKVQWGASLAIAAVLFVSLERLASRNLLTIENRSGTTIESVEAEIGRETHHIVGPIASGAFRAVGFGVTQDSHFDVTVTLDDGRVLTNAFGYFSGGAGSRGNRAKLVVHTDGLHGTQN